MKALDVSFESGQPPGIADAHSREANFTSFCCISMRQVFLGTPGLGKQATDEVPAFDSLLQGLRLGTDVSRDAGKFLNSHGVSVALLLGCYVHLITRGSQLS